MNNSIRFAAAVAAFVVSACAFAQGKGELILYSGEDFKGRNLTLRKNVGNFEPHGFNDRVSSIRVRHGTWELCTDSDYRGKCRVFEPGDYASLPGRENDAYSSARLVQGGGGGDKRPRITLYDNSNYSGRSVTLDESLGNFERIDFNDRVESVVVERGHWRLCSNSDGHGACREYGPGRYKLPPELRSKVSSAYPR